jgi:CubicO group peptidase (beta-lactamase class C family)
MKRLMGAALVLLTFAVPTAAQDLGRRLDEAIQRSTGGGLWGAVLVAREGEVLLAKGYGFADYATTPNRPDTLFEIASASKQFTAVAILRLEQDGKLSTDASIAMFFKGVPADKQAITIAQLLNHTSGIAPETGIPYASPLAREAFVRKILAEPLQSPPGERFAYCNAGYALLAAIVEVVSERSFEEYMANDIFARAGLESTGLIGDRTLIESGRDSVRLTDGPSDWTAANWHWGWGYRGMGGVVTTVRDLLRWDRALRGDDILDDQAKRKLYAPGQGGYALGWIVATTPRGTTKVFHGGGVAGYACLYVRYLDEDAVIAILSNGRQNVGAVEAAITEILFPSPRVEVTLDATPYALNELRAAMLEGGLALDVKRDGDSVRITLRQGEHEALAIIAPAADARRMVRDLEQAIAVRAKDDDGGSPALEAGLYLNAYPVGMKRIELDESIRIVIMPRYVGRKEDGSTIVDERVILVVQDTGRGFWPSIVRMNQRAADDLLTRLRGAVR